MKSKTAILIAATFALSGSAARGDEANAAKVLAAASLKMGIVMGKAIADLNPNFPPVEGPPSENRAALEKALKVYRAKREFLQGELAVQKGAIDFLVDSGAVIASISGVGAVPALLGRGAAQLATDLYFTGAQNRLNDEMQALLASQRDKLLNVGGVAYEDLRGKSPQEIRDRLAGSTQVFADMKTMFPDDPSAQKMAEDLLIEGIKNTQLETLNLVAKNTSRIDGVGRRFVALTKSVKQFEFKTLETLDKHAGAIGRLQVATSTLNVAVEDINNRLRKTEDGQAFLADFAFERMDPALKAAALRRGVIDHRFECTATDMSCDKAGLKADLIRRYDAEAGVATALSDVRSTVAALHNISTIAKNVGLDLPPEIDRAVQLGSVSVEAFGHFSSGNYLGAIAAITGIFGKSVDPAAERHKAMMSYLKDEFDQINKKLALLLENQQKLMEMIVKLSDQLSTYYQALDERLARMEFELGTISDAVKAQAWAPWESCYSIYFKVTADEARFGWRARGDFASLKDIHSVAIDNKGSLLKCLEVAQSKPVTITAPNWFGNLLDIDKALEFSPDAFSNVADKTKFHEKGKLQSYIAEVYLPSLRLTMGLLEKNKVPPARAFQLLQSPNSKAAGIAQRLQGNTTDGRAACGPNGYLHVGRSQRLLCNSPLSADELALRLLRKPLVVDHVTALADWMLLFTRIADVVDGASKDVLAPEQVTDAARAGRIGDAGRDILQNTQLLLDASIASYAMTYGDLASQAALDALTAPKQVDGSPAEIARLDLYGLAAGALRSNSYLAANTAHLFLRKRLAEAHGGVTLTGRPSALIYGSSFEYARRAQGDRFILLSGLFGNDLEFSADVKNRIMVTLVPNADEKLKVKAELPGPARFEEGELIYPPRLEAILRQRERVGERLIDYDLLKELTENERLAVIGLIARTSQAQAPTP